ncbi:histidine phosphatase family protein [Nocardioides sp. R-C-SC26]|uniref:SixA phosphatase family protein n=1 Tax=Nocardioides sp. R-C-SC26 TaxID=2870414 RepID=UPI001E5A9B6C|nr:histidine phosphatase family protein [Nocardioides sp. R-C-SC26]
MDTAAPRTLIVMRHAKAEQWGPDDFGRQLAERGRRDAAAAGQWMAATGLCPDHALVSGAVRTSETFDHVVRGAGWDLEPELSRPLYAADVDSALDLIRLTDGDVRALLVVGHNPTVAYLAQLLDDGEGDAAASAELIGGTYPTSALTTFDLEYSWRDLAAGRATVRGYHVGRG